MASGNANEEEVAMEMDTRARVTRSAKSAATPTRVTRRTKQADMEDTAQLKEVPEITEESKSIIELDSAENSNGMVQTENSESQDVDECSNLSNQGSLPQTTDVEDLEELPVELFEFNPDTASGDNAISFEEEAESIINEVQIEATQVNSEGSELHLIRTEASQEKSEGAIHNEVESVASQLESEESFMNKVQDNASQVTSGRSLLDEVQAEASHEETIQLKSAETTEAESREEVDMVPEKSNDEGLSEHTEVVSEDEFPSVEKPEVEDAENVSDDELPGPRHADLPEDTEVVSEDELPSVKKEEATSAGGSATAACNGRKRKQEEGYDPGSPTSESETSAKKQALVKNSDSKPAGVEKRPSLEEKPKKKVLPDLDKYWKTVNEDPSDFTGWTYLLQYVDQESDVDAAREAYDAFLSHYPYCYGYWRKYADYEKRKGSKKKCLEVLERGLRAIPLSVDLWIHYLNHVKATRPDDRDHVRSQYERAIDACGLEFRSDRLWESYIKWETEHGTLLHVTAVYDRLLATPTLGYTTHFDNFQEHIMSHAPNACIPVSDFVRLRGEVREGGPTMVEPDADIPPGEEEGDDHMRSDEEGASIKERIIAARRKIHKANVEQVMLRWGFEEGIKRPYFHVKPLEKCQLKNWKSYLDWEQQNGDLKRTLVLHERCLIACALYEEFWLRLIRYLEEQNAAEGAGALTGRIREVLERACSVHHLDKPMLHMHWAYFEERQGNATKAADILERLEKTCPNLLQIAFRRINLERRRGDLDKCSQLYEQYIAAAKSKSVASWLSSKYARFLQRSRADAVGAARVLADAVVRDSLCSRLYLQQLDLALQAPDVNYDTVGGFLEAYTSQEGADPETKLQFVGRLAELAEELGSSAEAAQRASELHRTVTRTARKQRRKQATLAPSASNNDGKKKETPTPPPGPPVGQAAPGGAGGYGGYGAGGGYYAGTAPHPPQQGYEGYQQAGGVGGYQPWPGAPTPGPGPYQQHPPGPGPYQQHAWPHSQYPNYY